MSLTKYKQKRKFDITPEPSDSHTRLHFVIQKHQASHLHYDFRLEIDEFAFKEDILKQDESVRSEKINKP